jgi:branched-chain amino acid transport system substrate-binding protein
MKGKKTVRYCVLTILAILLILPSTMIFATGQQQDTTAEGDVIRIGAALSLTGGFSTAGTLVKRGYDAWVDYVNSKGGITVQGKRYSVEMVYYDDKSEAPTSAKLVEKLITEDKVNLILGPYSSPITITTSTIAEKYGYVMISPMANGDAVYARGLKYLFSVLPPATAAIRWAPDLALERDPNIKTFATVVMDNAYTLSLGQGIQERSRELGLEEVYYAKYAGNTTDYSSILTAIKDKQPDCIYFGGFFQQLVNFYRQAKQYDVNAKYWVMAAGTQQPDWIEVMGTEGDYVVGNIFYHPKLEYEGTTFASTKDFTKFYNETHDHEVDNFTACGFVSGVLLKLAIEKADSLDQAKIRDALRNNKFKTFMGEFAWNEKGENIGCREALIQTQNAQHVLVWPEVPDGGRLIYPAPDWKDR